MSDPETARETPRAEQRDDGAEQPETDERAARRRSREGWPRTDPRRRRPPAGRPGFGPEEQRAREHGPI